MKRGTSLIGIVIALAAGFAIGWQIGSTRPATGAIELRESFTGSIMQIDAGGGHACVVPDSPLPKDQRCSTLLRRSDAPPLHVGDHVGISRQLIRTQDQVLTEVFVIYLPPP